MQGREAKKPLGPPGLEKLGPSLLVLVAQTFKSFSCIFVLFRSNCVGEVVSFFVGLLTLPIIEPFSFPVFFTKMGFLLFPFWYNEKRLVWRGGSQWISPSGLVVLVKVCQKFHTSSSRFALHSRGFPPLLFSLSYPQIALLSYSRYLV